MSGASAPSPASARAPRQARQAVPTVKTVTHWRRSQGITEERKKLHSLRKNFTERLERAGVPDSTISLLVGHKGRRGFTLSVYSPHGPGLKMLAAAVAKVIYKGLRL